MDHWSGCCSFGIAILNVFLKADFTVKRLGRAGFMYKIMAITRDFKETVKARALRDPAFREGLLRESIECMLSGDIATGKTILRDYIKATIGLRSWAK